MACQAPIEGSVEMLAFITEIQSRFSVALRSIIGTRAKELMYPTKKPQVRPSRAKHRTEEVCISTSVSVGECMASAYVYCPLIHFPPPAPHAPVTASSLASAVDRRPFRKYNNAWQERESARPPKKVAKKG